ncbi:MAG: helix-turn-helix domain-containing protein [Candidatus Latescibacterota bacterium]
MQLTLMRRVLDHTGGNISEAAVCMGLAGRNLQRKIQEYLNDVDPYIAKGKGRRGGIGRRTPDHDRAAPPHPVTRPDRGAAEGPDFQPHVRRKAAPGALHWGTIV